MAAAALGAQRGFDAISMADIGAEAGIVGSGIYRHFDSKTAILVAMADRVMDRLMTRGGRDRRRLHSMSASACPCWSGTTSRWR